MFQPLDKSHTVFIKLIADEARCRTFCKQMERKIGLTNFYDKYLIAHCRYQQLINVYMNATDNSIIKPVSRSRNSITTPGMSYNFFLPKRTH